MKNTILGDDIYMYTVMIVMMAIMGVAIFFILKFKEERRDKRDFIRSHYDTVIILLKAKLGRAKSNKTKSKIMVDIDEQQFQKNYYLDYPHEFDNKFKTTQK